jgi:hypothetical protein
MCDGSSRPINKDADIELLERLVTRAGGENVSLADAGGNLSQPRAGTCAIYLR